MANVDALARLAELCNQLERLLRYDGAPQVRFLSVAGAARYATLSTKSIRRLLSSGKLTAYRPVRGKVLIDLRQLDSLVLASDGQRRHGRGIRRITGAELKPKSTQPDLSKKHVVCIPTQPLESIGD